MTCHSFVFLTWPKLISLVPRAKQNARFADCASNWIYDPQNTAAFLEYYPVSGWHISLT
jgi:hypothetical protein